MVEESDVKILRGFGKRLRIIREKAAITQLDVATKAHMDVNYYARIERGLGNPSYLKFHRIMTALNIKSLDIE
jgi:transcriptional regulator with XRE-family HTH domain